MSHSTAAYMLEEYKQIANGYQDLHAQHNELVKSYLTLVAVPASLLALAIQFINVESIPSTDLLNVLNHVVFPIVFGLLIVLCLVGLAVVLALTSTRAEALLYVRTVNCVRRYFVEHDPEGTLKRYLVLPDFDTFPLFYEGPTWKSLLPAARSYWNVSMVMLLNSGIVFATLLSVVEFAAWLSWPCDLFFSFSSALLWLVLQHTLHWRLLNKQEKSYERKFELPFPSSKRIGVDLDGVLNDLAGQVIQIARSRFALDISRKDITCHDLTRCTDLTAAQVKEIFQATDVFHSSAPADAAIDALSKLHTAGWTIHIVTDRFWHTRSEDWAGAKVWLEKYGFEWDHLDLARASEKAKYAQSYGLSVFVEDNYDTAIGLSRVCDRVYLLDQPYNQGDLPPNVYRVPDWFAITKDLGLEDRL
jgi:uncharacterized HAD superfamily protein